MSRLALGVSAVADVGQAGVMTTFDEDLRSRELLAAQERAVALFAAVEEAGVIRPGVTDWQASDAVRDLAAAEFGVDEHWHKRIVRSGPNTLQPYTEDPPDRTMTDDDIAFADFGPVFTDWEADFGRTWVIGDDPEKQRLVADLPVVFDETKAWFAANPDATGGQLFAEVTRLTEARGWTFGNFHCGHMVGEFPHENHPEKLDALLWADSEKRLSEPDPSGRVAHWILEVHLVDEARQIGGFYEELLTL
jgi:Xaa-Pro dipeptidase